MNNNQLYFFIVLTTLLIAPASLASEQSASTDASFSLDAELAALSLNTGDNLGGFVTPPSVSPTAAFASHSRKTSRRKHKRALHHGNKKMTAEDASVMTSLQALSFATHSAAAAPAPLPNDNPFTFDFGEPFRPDAAFDLKVNFNPNPSEPITAPRKILSTGQYRKKMELKALQQKNKQMYAAWKKENDERYEKAETARKRKVLMSLR
jgi:hypothetical protein